MATRKGDSSRTLSGTSAEPLGGALVCGIDPEEGPPRERHPRGDQGGVGGGESLGCPSQVMAGGSSENPFCTWGLLS